MLAMRVELDVLDDDEIVVAGNLLEGAAKLVGRALVIAVEHLAKGFRHALGRVDEALALGVVAGPAQQGAHGGLHFLLARTVGDRPVHVGGGGHDLLDDGIHKRSLP